MTRMPFLALVLMGATVPFAFATSPCDHKHNCKHKQAAVAAKTGGKPALGAGASCAGGVAAEITSAGSGASASCAPTTGGSPCVSPGVSSGVSWGGSSGGSGSSCGGVASSSGSGSAGASCSGSGQSTAHSTCADQSRFTGVVATHGGFTSSSWQVQAAAPRRCMP
ncbi:MAG: hypothetical protein IPK67_12410 [Planctomycetes bacterium]|nr:hypothetical protein [Planctomycetota bacterium]